jgi:hypothetical protein
MTWDVLEMGHLETMKYCHVDITPCMYGTFYHSTFDIRDLSLWDVSSRLHSVLGRSVDHLCCYCNISICCICTNIFNYPN